MEESINRRTKTITNKRHHIIVGAQFSGRACLLTIHEVPVS